MREPFFSVCIPQHNRTSFLLLALESLASQSFRDFEVCISDDASSDGRQDEVVARLRRLGLEHRYERRQSNGRYDTNLRSAIGLARGRYCLLLGNDDALAHSQALQALHSSMLALGPCGVVIPDYEDFTSHVRAFRVRHTANRGAGPGVAVRHFRNFSFVSGVTLLRAPAAALATESWDGSEMYQTYLGCRIIAGGHALLEIGEPLIRKDIRIPGEVADSYARHPRVDPCPIIERPVPLVQLGRLVADAIQSVATGSERRALNASILRQLVGFTYPFWLIEFRRVQSWRYAAGIALAMRPRHIARGVALGWVQRPMLTLHYFVMTCLGLFTPQGVFRLLRPALYRLARGGGAGRSSASVPGRA